MLTLRDALCDVGKIYIILQQIYLGNYIPNFIRIDHLHSFVGDIILKNILVSFFRTQCIWCFSENKWAF